MVVVDTTVWIDYFNGVQNPESDWVDLQLEHQRIGITDLNLCELLQGFGDEITAKKVERQLRRLELLETGGVALAFDAARNYRTLRGRGHTVRKTIDCLIASYCLRERHSLLHRDRDYDPFELILGLSVVHP